MQLFFHNDSQKEIAEYVIENLEKSKLYDKPIATVLKPVSTFYLAEEHHQDYYKSESSPLRSI